jgi:hypothetical protein
MLVGMAKPIAKLVSLLTAQQTWFKVHRQLHFILSAVVAVNYLSRPPEASP